MAEFSKKDYEYMSSLSEAVLGKAPKKSKHMIYLMVFGLFGAILWANYAQIDELARGQGKIIPSGKNQTIQNLEGGIIKEILVKEGEEVRKDQSLFIIDNQQYQANLLESEEHLRSLNAKKQRLLASSEGKEFKPDLDRVEPSQKRFLALELSLYIANQQKLEEQINILKEQIKQKRNEILEVRDSIAKDKESYELSKQELTMLENLLKTGNVSKVAHLKAKKEANELKKRISTAGLSIPRIESTIAETENKIDEVIKSYRATAKKELSETEAEIARLIQIQKSLKDKVTRTNVLSPADGIISKLMINTIGGVIKPGQDLAEIVPLDDSLVVEVKIKPSDVAFIRQDAEAIVKITAYDFSIYGGLKGRVERIGADTQTNEKTGESYYLVRIKTEKNYLGSDQKPLKLKVGMIASADILTGKKSVLDYLLKPVLKAKHNALRERWNLKLASF